MYVNNIAAPTVAASSPVTYTNAYTLDIAGPPNPGSNVTIGTEGALRVGSGQAQFNGLISGVGGATLIGGTVNLNTSNNNITNIGTGSTNANVNIGGGSNIVAIGSPLTLAAGTTSKAPLTLTAGTTLATPAAGSVEYDGTQLYLTPASATRNILAQVSGGTALTAGSIPFVTSNGLLTQNNSDLFWNNTTDFLGIGTTTPSNNVSIMTTPSNTVGSGALSIGNFGNPAQAFAFRMDSGTNFNIDRLSGGSWSNALNLQRGSGNIGIGTSTPYSRLTVWGADTSGNTAALTIGNSASTTELQVFDNGNATLAGTLTQNSDQRLKTNIQSLNNSVSVRRVWESFESVTGCWNMCLNRLEPL
jgi:hypothetical protein